MNIKQNRKSLKFYLALFIFSLVGVTLILRTTLAANINLNAGGPVEFGQGVAHTVVCDDSVLVTPFSVFRNQQGGGSFKLGSIKIGRAHV